MCNGSMQRAGTGVFLQPLMLSCPLKMRITRITTFFASPRRRLFGRLLMIQMHKRFSAIQKDPYMQNWLLFCIIYLKINGCKIVFYIRSYLRGTSTRLCSIFWILRGKDARTLHWSWTSYRQNFITLRYQRATFWERFSRTSRQIRQKSYISRP